MVGTIDHIGDGLHITDIETLAAASTSEYNAVVSVCQDTCRDNVSDTTPYSHVALADDEHSQERWGGSCDYNTFFTAAECVRGSWLAHGNVVAHCHVGKNRSAAACAAAWAVEQDTTVYEALQTISETRPLVSPNDRMLSYATRYARFFR